MILEAVSDVVVHVSNHLSSTGLAPLVGGFGNPCPKAPPGTATQAATVIAWVKWGVLGIILAAGFASIGGLVVGKVFQNGRAAQFGASSIMWVLLAALLFGLIYVLITSVVGSGC